jgi:serine protease Do
MKTYKIVSYGIGLVAGGLILAGARVEWPASSHAESTPAKPAVAIADLKGLSQTFTTLSENLSPAVVSIYTKSKTTRQTALPPQLEQEFEEHFGMQPFNNIPQMDRETLGSGFVIDASEGYIATNAHVVRQAGKNADEIMIKFNDEKSGKGHPAKIVGADEISDVALLKLVEKRPGLKAVKMGDSAKAKVGEFVLAIGNPYGHTNTVTEGIVSATGRNIEGARSDFLQTSASINPGNSGGPLINLDGEVIGINSIIDPRAQNIGFAIPVNTAKQVIEQLRNAGRVERAWLGIGIEDINDETAGMMRLKDSDGVLVKQVMNNTPAAKAGIERFDVIRKIGDDEVHNTHDLFRSMEKLHSGSVADVLVWRGGSNKTVKVKFADQPSQAT